MYLLPLAQEPQPGVIQLETAFVVALLLITAVALLVRKVKIPYTVALVVAGLALAFLRSLLPSELVTMGERSLSDAFTSELILALFVPPLIFEGALHIDWKTFRANLTPILLMAVVGLLLATFIVGGVILAIDAGFEHLASLFNLALPDLIEIPFLAAIAFGALISATDPVAVIAFFRSLGVDKRLSILVEGESLLNDGVSIVVFKLALGLGGVAAASHASLEDAQFITAQFDLLQTAWNFLLVAFGGLAVGLVVARLAEFVLKYIEDRLVETTVTMPVAFGAYILAESFHFSGILAVVAAGIYLGVIIPSQTTPSTKIALYNFWELLSFMVTSLIFLLIGLVIGVRQFFSIQNLVLVAAAVVAILLARALVVYGMSAVSKRLRVPVPLPYQHVMFWGGLRGAISLALALSLSPDSFGPGVGEQLRLMTFGVVLFTLLVQGTTIEKRIKNLGLSRKSQSQIEKERYLGRYYAARAAHEELNRLHRKGVVSGSLWEAMSAAQQAELEQCDYELREMFHRYPGVSSELALQARQAMLKAERSALGEAVLRDIISEDLQDQMLEDLDARIEVLDLIAERSTVMSMLSIDHEGDQTE